MDVGFTLSGDPSAAYLTTLTAADVAGGIKADYDMIANRDWLTYGKSEDVEAKVGEDQ